MNIAFGMTLLALLAADGVWISSALPMYRAATEAVQNAPMRVRTQYAVVAYVFVCISLAFLAYVAHRIPKRALGFYALLGAVFGFAVYGIYNFTTAALLTRYPLRVAIIDTLWGTLLFGSMLWLYVWLRRRSKNDV
jgi:uncharacterized membrane protein